MNLANNALNVVWCLFYPKFQGNRKNSHWIQGLEATLFVIIALEVSEFKATQEILN